MSTSTLIGADAARLAGLQIDLLQKYRKRQLTLGHLKWFLGLTKAERDALCMDGKASLGQESSPMLRLILEVSDIVLPATDAQRIIDAENVFDGYIDISFRKLVGTGEAAPETMFDVYEMARDATFKEMFGSLTEDPRTLALTQGQIVELCRMDRSWICSNHHATFFIFENSDELFVAHVSVGVGGLCVRCYSFEYCDVWNADYRHRLVVPQR